MLTDLKYALRQWLKNPGFTVSVVLILALGIGANLTEFSLTNAVLLKPLPWYQADRLVYVWDTYALLGWKLAPVSIPDYLDRQSQTDVFQDTALYSAQNFNLGNGPRPLEVTALSVTPSFFNTLRLHPFLGRGFTDDEGLPGHDKEAILTYALWQSQFGGRSDVIGTDARLNGQNYRIVGVMPRDFVEPSAGLSVIHWDKADLLVPYAIGPAQKTEKSRGNWNKIMIARLKPGVTVPQAQQEIDAVVRQLVARLKPAHPVFRQEGGFGGVVVNYREQNVQSSRPVLLLLQAAVTLVLLIACGNVANLLLARAVARKKETAIRLALGASPWRLVRQILTENVVLMVAGVAGGILLGDWVLHALHSRLAELPNGQAIGIDAGVLGFALAISLVCVLLITGVLTVSWWSSDAGAAWNEGGTRGSSAGRSSGFTRATLVVGEVALAMLLLVATGLTLKSFAKLQAVQPGFVSEGVLTARLSLPGAVYRDGAAQAALYTEAIRQMRSLPGVKYASAASTLPLAGVSTGDYSIKGFAARRADEPGLNAQIRVVAGDYFEALGIPLIQGRYLSDDDTAQKSLVVVIDQFLAQRWFPGLNPIGHQIGGATNNAGWYTIVGVVGVVKPGDLAEPVTKESLYFPVAQDPTPGMNLVIKTTADPETLVAPVERILRQLDPELPLFDIQTMDQRVSDSLASHRSSTLLFAAFGMTALLLASLGLYGMLAYSVSQRTREIGIRIALGARSQSIVALIVGEGMRLTGLGLAIGFAASLVLSRLLRSLLFGVSTSDPAVFAVIPLLLLVVAFVACYLPARRATKVDPIIALRAE